MIGLQLICLTFPQITTMVYLKVSVSDFLTLFSARIPDAPFYSTRPSGILLGAATASLVLTTILATSWPPGRLDGIACEGMGREEPKALALYVWLYCLLVWLVQDVVKVYTVRFLKKNNTFGKRGQAPASEINASHTAALISGINESAVETIRKADAGKALFELSDISTGNASDHDGRNRDGHEL